MKKAKNLNKKQNKLRFFFEISNIIILKSITSKTIDHNRYSKIHLA